MACIKSYNRGSSGSPTPPFFILAWNSKLEKGKKKGKPDRPQTNDHCHVSPNLNVLSRPSVRLRNNQHRCTLQSPIVAMRRHGARCAACRIVARIGNKQIHIAIFFGESVDGPVANRSGAAKNHPPSSPDVREAANCSRAAKNHPPSSPDIGEVVNCAGAPSIYPPSSPDVGNERQWTMIMMTIWGRQWQRQRWHQRQRQQQ